MELRKIRFLSASDRINYGDFLFPLIFKQVLKQENENIVFKNYGIVKSDFSYFGALKTNSFRKLENDIEDGDKIVIGGGEVLYANWTTLYAFINPLFQYLLRFKKIKALEKSLGFSSHWLSSNNVPFPFSFKASDFKLTQLKVYYSSVGGGGLMLKKNRNQQKAYERMRSARMISLRDNRSFNYFSIYPELDAKLIPDSALLMSDFYSIERLKELVKNSFNHENYIFLQLGINKGPKDLKKFARQLQTLSNDLKCKVLLCPIGLAPGHEDNKILKELKGIEPRFDFIMPNNIFDIMYLIANSNLYIGTSLHGAITAMSFLKPAIGLNKKVVKLESYMKTWVNEEYRNLEFDNINYSDVNELMNLYNISYGNERLEMQKSLIRSNLKFIIND